MVTLTYFQHMRKDDFMRSTPILLTNSVCLIAAFAVGCGRPETPGGATFRFAPPPGNQSTSQPNAAELERLQATLEQMRTLQDQQLQRQAEAQLQHEINMMRLRAGREYSRQLGHVVIE